MTDPTLRDIADSDALMSHIAALQTLELIARQVPRSQQPVELHLDEDTLASDGTFTALHPDSVQTTAASTRFGEYLVFLIVGRMPISEQDAFEPAVQGFPQPIVTLISRDLGDSNGQWVSHDEWLSTLQRELDTKTTPLTAVEQANRLKSWAVAIGGALLVAAISTAIIIYALTSWASS